MVQKVQMPERLDWALEGLVRAVLLHQPEDIYLFAAQHFDKILQSRQVDDDDEPIKNYENDIPAQEDIAKTVILPDLNESLISDNPLLEDEAIEQAVIESEDTTESEQNIIEEIISAEQATIVAEGVPETTAASELEQDGGVEDSEMDKVPPTEEVELLDINPENTGLSDISQISEKIVEFEGAEEDETGLEVEDSTEAEKSVDAEDAGEAGEKLEAEDAVKDVKVEDAEKSVDVEDIEEVDLAENAEKIVDVDDTDEAVKSVNDEDIGEADNTEDIGDAEKLVDVEDTDEAVKSVDVEDVREAENEVEIEGIGDAEKLVDVENTDEAVKSVDVEEAENVPEEAVKMVDVDDGEVDQTTENDTQPEDEKKELNASSEEKIETVDDGDVISLTDSQSIQNPEIVLVNTEENPGASVEESTGESLKDEDQIESSALDENIDTSLDDTIQTEPVSEMNSEINIPPTSLPEVVFREDNNIATESVEPLIAKENAAVTNVQTSESQDNEARQNPDEVNDDTGSIEISETKESNPEVEDSEFSPSAPPLEPENSENSVDSKEEIQKNEVEQNNLEEPIKDDDKNSEGTENTEETQKALEEETGNPDLSEIIANDTVGEAKGQTIGEVSAEAADSLDTKPAQYDDNEKEEEEIPQNYSSAETNVLKQDDSETSNDNEVTAVEQASEELEPQNSNESNNQVADEVLPSEPGPEKSDLDPEINNVSEQEPIATQETSGDSLIAPEAEDAPSLTEITSQEINESEVNSKSEVDNSEKEAPLTDFLRSSGEFHDMIVVLPDDAFNTSNDADDIETLDSKTEDAQPTEEEEGDDDQVGAATKIQASYRGYRTRKKLKKLPAETETSEEQSSLNEKTVTTNPEDKTDEAKDVANDENTEGDIIPTDNEVDDTEGNEAAAATLIQSSYRGYRTRKNLKQTKEQKGTLSAEANNSDEVIAAGSPDKNQEPSQDELNEAATKIQASARGYMARKKLSRSNEAATTIQKNYRGYRTRKNLTKSAKTDTGTSNVPNDNTP